MQVKMRRIDKIAGLVLIAFAVSSCSLEDSKVMAPSSESVKAEKDSGRKKCCSSNIPARFPVKSNNIPQPATGN
jgi:hypothetical protein